jgi:hypothetical protein
MDEMTKLSAFRDEVPVAPPSPAARRLFHAGLREESTERTGLTAYRRRLLPAGRPRRWQLAAGYWQAPGLRALGGVRQVRPVADARRAARSAT